MVGGYLPEVLEIFRKAIDDRPPVFLKRKHKEIEHTHFTHIGDVWGDMCSDEEATKIWENFFLPFLKEVLLASIGGV